MDFRWRRKWHPTPVFLPGESCGWRSLVGCCPWGHTESDTTEWLIWSDLILYRCFSFWLTSLCIIGSSFIHLIRTDSNVFFLNGWVILHCVYVPQLSYPFFCWWTSRLLPCPGYYKQCCDEHWGTCISFNSGFLGVYAQQWDCWIIRQLFQFFKESPHCSP